ncbi:MAG: hypothetical protein KGD64_02945 [Candidatus Heimdallarchaeota archaeon]|nr:hypothetical protein [Candidatus Heimdallarchaeota archaeon]
MAFYPPQGHSYDPESRGIEHLKIIKGGMRISFSFMPKDMIDVGVRRLGKLLHETLEKE